MRIVWLLILALVFSTLPLRAAEWTLLKRDGREYIPFENVAEFYGLTAVQRSGARCVMSLGNRSLRGEEGSPDFFINNLKFILSYPVAEIGGKLCVSRMDLVKIIEPVMRPSRISGNAPIDTIVLDAGHGGHDSGVGSSYVGSEKDYTLDTVLRARLRLMQAGFKVELTRKSDVFVPLEERVAYANQFPNALFVSVHFNSSGAGSGIETYTLAPCGVPSMMADGPRVSDLQSCRGNCRDAENIALATATHASLIIRSHMYDRGIKRARFVVIRDLAIPGVLIEGGFLSNMYDVRMIAQPAYRDNLAAAIVDAALNYRSAVSAPGTPPLARNSAIVLPELTTPNPKAPGGIAYVTTKEKPAAPAAKKPGGAISTEAAVAGSAARVDISPN